MLLEAIQGISILDISLVIAFIVAIVKGLEYLIEKIWGRQRKRDKELNDRLLAVENSMDELHTSLAESSEREIDVDQKMDKYFTILELQSAALLSILRNDLLISCRICLKQGFATLEDKETISAQYQAYHALGGDTFITDLKNQVMSLPIEKVQKERKSTKKVLNETL